jgi:predicted MPP superfamily phosphohydrolase
MTHDWPGTATIALAVPAALGHLAHWIWTINVGSGLGLRERTMERIRAAQFAGFSAASALLLWTHFQSPWWTWPWPLYGYAVLCVLSGTLVLPICSLLLAFRKQPAGVSQTRAIHELASPGDRAECVGDGPHSWLLHLPGNASFRLCLREWDVAIPALPEPMEGLRIVQLSDFHLAPCFQPRYFERAIGACRHWHADFVFVTGDIVEHEEAIAWIEPLLGSLDARLGKFAILGNHDEENQPQAIVKELVRAGFDTLEGEWTAIEVEGAILALGGTAAPWGPDVDPHVMPPADFRILLSHSPDRFYRAARSGINLVFAGHNHGGQIRLPLVGPVFMPSRYSRRFDRGFFRRGRTLMYVSEGIAGRHPVRYGCLPEVTRFTLRNAVGSAVLRELENRMVDDRNREAMVRDWM